MKVQQLGLQTSLVTVYDQTKTTLQGRATQRTIIDGNGPKLALGPSPVISASVFDDTGVAPAVIHCSTANGRVFIGKGISTNVWTISYYTLNKTTGAEVWVGDLKLTLGAAAITYTIKGFVVDDSNPSSMTIMAVATHTTATNGGLFVCWGVNITDFVKVSVATFPVATLASQSKVVYQLGDGATQAAQTLTVADGVGYDPTAKEGVVLSGAAASPSVFRFSLSVPPASVPLANGYTNAAFTLKTGTLSALSGTVLLVNNVQVITPSHTSNAGSLCLAWLTSTNIYIAKLSDITNGAVTLPSLVTANMADSADYLIPTAQIGQYFAELDKWVIGLSTGQFIAKQCVSNDPNGKFFGGPSNIKTELGGTVSPPDFGQVANLCLTNMAGWAVITSITTGQRSFLAIDLYSDESSVDPSTGQIYTSVIAPAMSGNIAVGCCLANLYELAKRGVKPTVQYRTSNFSVGPGVGFDATWTTAPKDGDLSAIANVSQVQFRFLFTIMGMEVSNSPQLVESYFIYVDKNEMSDYWALDNDNTTQGTGSPSYVSLVLLKPYPTSVPTIFFRGYDMNGNVLFTQDTVTNAAQSGYSTNGGTSWNALGTVPNTPGTRLRMQILTPPGVLAIASGRES